MGTSVGTPYRSVLEKGKRKVKWSEHLILGRNRSNNDEYEYAMDWEWWKRCLWEWIPFSSNCGYEVSQRYTTETKSECHNNVFLYMCPNYTLFATIVPIKTVALIFIIYWGNHAVSANFVEGKDYQGRLPTYGTLCWNPSHGLLELLYHQWKWRQID